MDYIFFPLGLTNFPELCPYSILTELLLRDIPKQQGRLHEFESGSSECRMEEHSMQKVMSHPDPSHFHTVSNRVAGYA